MDLVVMIGVASTVTTAVTPALADHGFNVRTGAGVIIALLLGLVAAVCPVIWTHRAGNWLIRRWIA